ncbi:CopL family metal-binding regulatory protein [Steroidobacter sp.]|uniref:CopL family metal-binding regulatory protein n=1 Tax=Steroidobacter sp. TaxID=1978227 RepID=UPI001A42C052|nr:CopL family metal-binding regulatory protein [Steroidobacter sp.]
MHRAFLHRWSIVLLLIARLVLGEFAYSMPHPAESGHAEAAPAVTQTQERPCPDHVTTAANSENPAVSEDLTSKPHDSASHEHCCETGCDCACLHLSGLAMPPATLNVAPPEEHLLAAPAFRHTPDRISLLFRPPA